MWIIPIISSVAGPMSSRTMISNDGRALGSCAQQRLMSEFIVRGAYGIWEPSSVSASPTGRPKDLHENISEGYKYENRNYCKCLRLTPIFSHFPYEFHRSRFFFFPKDCTMKSLI